MAVFPVRLFGDPVLRVKGAAVEDVNDGVQKLVDDLFETMGHAAGIGLAAPQIGVSKRVIVWQYEGERGALINGEVVERDGQVEDDEACLSLPGLTYPVVRSQKIRVAGLDRDGKPIEIEAEDMVARILQHEIDHTDGILFIDHLDPDLQKEAKRVLREQALAGAPGGPSTQRL